MSDIIKNHTVYRVTCTNANTEYSQALSDRATKVTLSADDLSSVLLFAFTSSGSATGKRVFNGAEWGSPGFMIGSKTIYFQSPSAGAVAVIEEWDKG